ncbi:ADP-ribose pyrophosphatase [Constrictibacter sp. MBR-5]|uniref:NUDIX domain-containing protein n=1 Tax=Constrictibacter sp. MBR-5 TaxID=3156467 RepID=UPI0033997E76
MTVRDPKHTFGRTDVDIMSQEPAYRGYFRIDRVTLRHRLHAGGWSAPIMREVFERGHAAAVLPYDPILDRVVLLEQFRIGAWSAGWNPWIVEIPAGTIEPGETAEAVAIRETVEETGSTLSDIRHICDYLSTPGGASETVSLYCGRVDAAAVGGIHGNAHEVEDILVYTVPYAEVRAALDAGAYGNSVTIIALQWLALNRDRLRAEWGVA